jgi:N6-adenosine-specific RNA methylase IME4/ParB-like chromosome segregation protein Spo0J
MTNGQYPKRRETYRTAGLRLHKRSGLVPPMADEEYRAFLIDIANRGLQTPLDINAAGVVLDGHQRLRAATELGLASVPVRTVSPTDEIEYMLLAALRRRQLSPSQRAALVVELEQVREQRECARQRSSANLRQGERRAEVATLPPRGERTRETAARLAGVSARTVQDALTVRQADASLFDQVKAGEVPASVAARRVKRARRDRELPPAPPLPEGPYELIYADPPWQLGNPHGRHAPENHYPTMPLEEIAALAPPAASDGVLFLWAVNCLLPEALEVIDAWGFRYSTNLVWVKPSIGLGNVVRNRHELLLVGKRGSLTAPDPEDRPDSVIEAPRGKHSEKPASAYELIERMYPRVSKLELFARGTPRPGWTAWGNEVEAV